MKSLDSVRVSIYHSGVEEKESQFLKIIHWVLGGFFVYMAWIDMPNAVTGGRVQFLFPIFGLGIIFFSYQIGFLVLNNKKHALFASFLLFTSSFFLSYGFRIHFESIICFFQIFCIYLFLRFFKPTLWKWLLLGLFVLGITAIGYQNLGLFFENRTRFNYFSIQNFDYLFQFCKENPIIIASFFLAVFTSMKASKENLFVEKSFGNPFLIMSLILVISMIFYIDKSPFVINALLPIPILFAGWELASFLEKFSKDKGRILSRSFLLVIFILIGKAAHFVGLSLSENNSMEQKNISRP